MLHRKRRRLTVGTKLTEYKGYNIEYDTFDKQFHAKDSEGVTVAQATTQVNVEKQVDVIKKSKFKFPIKAMRFRSYASAVEGTITSLNPDDESLRFSSVSGYRQEPSSEKLTLRNAELFEVTEHNVKLAEEIAELGRQMELLKDKKDALYKQAEKPIGYEYFNLKPRYQ